MFETIERDSTGKMVSRAVNISTLPHQRAAVGTLDYSPPDEATVGLINHTVGEPRTGSPTHLVTKDLLVKKDTTVEQYGDVAEYLWERIQPITKQKAYSKKTWANDLRKIVEVDGYSREDIWNAFSWANNDDFWRSNILSPAKLRKKMPTITAKMSKVNQGESWK
jgi:hypothetical protein